MPSNSTYVCTECRVSVKKLNRRSPLCPHCAKSMICVGTCFKPPKKTNVKEWAKIRKLLNELPAFGIWWSDALKDVETYISREKEYASRSDPSRPNRLKRKKTRKENRQKKGLTCLDGLM